MSSSEILLEDKPKKTKFYDDRTLSITTGELSPEQICTALQAVMRRIRVDFGIPAYYHLAYVMTKNEAGKIIPKGWCYLTVNRPEVYHLMLGRKADGSENVSYTIDPNWIPPEEKESKEEEKLDFNMDYKSWGDFSNFQVSWADIMEEEIQKEQEKIEREPEMIKTYLGRLIPEPTVMTSKGLYTIEVVASRVKVDLESDDYLTTDTNKVQGYFPTALSVRDIENYFKSFSPSSDVYPEIVETRTRGPNRGPPTRLVIVKFKPTSHDALFVIQTNLRCVIRDRSGARHITYLSHPNAIQGR